MDTIQLLLEHTIGFSFFTFALISLISYNNEISRGRLPIFQTRLQQMRQRWGVGPGTVLHVLSYVVTPVGFGVMFLMGMVF